MIITDDVQAGIYDDREKANIIVDIICRHFGIERHMLLSKTRLDPIKTARWFCVYFLDENTNLGVYRISMRVFGRYDYNTVQYAKNKIRCGINLEGSRINRIYKQLIPLLNGNDIQKHLRQQASLYNN